MLPLSRTLALSEHGVETNETEPTGLHLTARELSFLRENEKANPSSSSQTSPNKPSVPASSLLADAAEEMRIVADLAPLVQRKHLSFERCSHPPGSDVSSASSSRTALSRVRLSHWANRLQHAHNRSLHHAPTQMRNLHSSFLQLRGRFVVSLDERGGGAEVSFPPFPGSVHLREAQSGELLPPDDGNPEDDVMSGNYGTSSDGGGTGDAVMEEPEQSQSSDESNAGRAAASTVETKLRRAVMGEAKRQLAKGASMSSSGIGLQVESELARADEGESPWLVWAMQRVVRQEKEAAAGKVQEGTGESLLDELVDAAGGHARARRRREEVPGR